MNSRPKSELLKEAVLMLLILAAVIWCVWPGMRAPMFSDDFPQLDKVKNLTGWTGIFGTDVFDYFRPAKNLIFMLAVPFEKNPMAWHWLGLGAYLAATLGVLGITATCLGSRRLGLLATAIWALSPTGVSTAVWLSCANISLGLLFGAAMFQAHEKLASRNAGAWLAPSLLCYALALLCYESLIAFPALLFFRDLQQRRLAIDKRTILRYAGYALTAIVFLAVRHHFSAKDIIGVSSHPGFSPDVTPARLALSAPWLLWKHFSMWFVPPGNLEVLGSYGWMLSASVASLVAAWAFLIALVASAVLTWKKLPAVSYGIVFFLVASFPSSNLVPCFAGPIHDAYLTIPSVGLAMMFASACGLLAAMRRDQTRRSASSGIAALTLLGILIFYRLPACAAYARYWAGVWQSPTKLMFLVSESRPNQFHAQGFASALLLGDGYLKPAETMANDLLRVAPWSQLARLTLARIAVHRNDPETAEMHFRSILASPTINGPLVNPTRCELASVLALQPEHREEAANLCRAILNATQKTQHTAAITLLARIYFDQGQGEKARATLVRGLSLYPQHEVMASMLATIDRRNNPTPSSPSSPP